SLADAQRAEELDPRDASIPANLAATYVALRQWKDAEQAALRALAMDPHNTIAAFFLLSTRLNEAGDVGSARRTFDGFPEDTKSRFLSGARGYSSGGDIQAIIGMPVYLGVIERRFADAFQALDKETAKDDFEHLRQAAGRVALRVLAGQT